MHVYGLLTELSFFQEAPLKEKHAPQMFTTPLPGQNPLSVPVHNLLSTELRGKDLLQHFTDTQMPTCGHTPSLTPARHSSQHSCPLVAGDLTAPGPDESESLGLEPCKFLQALQGSQETKGCGHMPGLQTLRLRATQMARFSDICHLNT